MRELVIDGVRIGDDTDCYVIAEIGHNHQGDLDRCKELFTAAKACGCHAVKLQKRDNKSLYSEEMYNSPYNSENAFGPTYGAHREALEFGSEQYTALKIHAEKLGITFFATAFDKPSVEFLTRLDMPAFKIASGDLTNRDLLEYVARKRRPTIISTGGAKSIKEVYAADAVFAQANCPLAILQCTSGYPARFEELNLEVLSTYRFALPQRVIGYSGHENGIAMAPVAFAMGARIIEKHFTLDRTWKGTDQAMSLEPRGMKSMIRDLKRVRLALGDGVKRRYSSESLPLTKQWKNAQGQIDGILPAA
jgi:sialic acid synthase